MEEEKEKPVSKSTRDKEGVINDLGSAARLRDEIKKVKCVCGSTSPCPRNPCEYPTEK